MGKLNSESLTPCLSTPQPPGPPVWLGWGPLHLLWGLLPGQVLQVPWLQSRPPAPLLQEGAPGAPPPCPSPSPAWPQAYVAASTCSQRRSSSRPLCPWRHSQGGAARTCPRTSRSLASGLWRGGTVEGAQEADMNPRGPHGSGRCQDPAWLLARPQLLQKRVRGRAGPRVHSMSPPKGQGAVCPRGRR